MNMIKRAAPLFFALLLAFSSCRTTGVAVVTKDRPTSDIQNTSSQSAASDATESENNSVSQSESGSQAPTNSPDPSESLSETEPSDDETSVEPSVDTGTVTESETTEPTVPTIPNETSSEDPETETPPEPKGKTEPADYKGFQTEEKVVAFTFDDGPNWVTPMILDLIDGTDDKVTFFIVGEMIALNPSGYGGYVKRARQMGCEVGSHTENHKMLTALSESAVKEQLEKVAKRYRDLTGEDFYLMRPPGGNFKKSVNYGYCSILWSLDSKDWKVYDEYNTKYRTESGVGILNTRGNDHKEERERIASEAAGIVANDVLSRVKPGDIVLMHDLWFPTAEAFSIIYKELKARGYRFVTVSELLNIDPAKYAGWYFYGTDDFGHESVAVSSSASSGEAFAALPPEKIN